MTSATADVTAADLKAMFGAIAVAIEAEKDRLSALDGAIGDGDHGVTMSTGFNAVVRSLADPGVADDDPASILNRAAKAFLNAVGASAGPLYATGFLRAAASVKTRMSLDREAVLGLVVAMARGMSERGKATRGAKTMMDAWLPAAEAVEAARVVGKSLAASLDDAVTAAAAGAESTKAMVAAKGRAARLGERSLGHMDPGAASAVIVLEAMRQSLAGTLPTGS